MLNVIVLGSAAGGGVPQWNCNCATCRMARDMPALHSGQMGLAVSGDGGRHWFLINASPDLRQQIVTTPRLAPDPAHLRHSPIAGVILTNGEVDAIAGLLSLREGTPFGLYAHRRVLDTLAANSIFNVLHPDRVPRHAIALDTPFSPTLPDGSGSGLRIEAFRVPGKPAWYLEGTEEDRADDGDTIGLTITGPGGAVAHVVAACAAVTPELAARLRDADLVFFDGTLWTDDEMIRGGLAQKTGQRMGHLSMSGPEGVMALLDGLGIRQKVFIHINNSNPVLLPGSSEAQAVAAAGWIVPAPGREFAT
jgi:pyrroloquinoline quinone biosynthesis protein B